MAYPTTDQIIAANPGVPTDANGPLGRLAPDTLAILIALKEGEGGSAATIADGADVAEGSTTDAPTAAGDVGTVSAKLRTVTAQLSTLTVVTNSLHTDLVQLHTDLTGARSSAITATPDRFTNLGLNATLNVKPTGGNVFSLICHNANAAARYVQLHNTATVPVTTAGVPIYSFYVPAGAQIGIGSDIFTNAGVNFATGIAFAFSTTRDVYTAATASDGSTVVHYK